MVRLEFALSEIKWYWFKNDTINNYLVGNQRIILYENKLQDKVKGKTKFKLSEGTLRVANNTNVVMINLQWIALV